MTLLTDALCAKYVQMHGVQTSKWTTQDKLTQYKGLVNLYKRDRDITQIDVAVAGKRQYKELANLRKTIDSNRKELDEVANGDRQQLRNTLADHRRLQMAYQYSPPKKVIDDIVQVNFTKRKVLDKLQYEMNQKSQQLIDLRLLEAQLADRLKYGQFTLDGDREAQNITGKVQNALLKKEAALAIQQTYVQIIDVMKKDALYFHGILTTIQSDYWYQCRCVLNATKQGQLATEYKNDREQEYDDLEQAVISDMKTQKDDLERVRTEAENLQANIKYLLRRDSDLTTCVLEVKDSEDVLVLHHDLQKIESALEILKNKTLVTSFEMIYPSLCEQVRQRQRLTALLKKCERNKEVVLNKLNHAELMCTILENTMVETTGDYKKRKKELLESIDTEMKKKEESDSAKLCRQTLIAQIRISLSQLQQLCKHIQGPRYQQRAQQDFTPCPITSDVRLPEEDEVDGLKMIEALTNTLSQLMSTRHQVLDSGQLDAAYHYYEVLMKEYSIVQDVSVAVRASFLEGLATEVSHLLTREDIKKQSASIVAAANKEDDVMPALPVKRKKKTKK